MTCRGFLQCTLKLLNFFLALVGAGMILYSLWMLKEWHSDSPPTSQAPSPAPFPLAYHVPKVEGGNLHSAGLEKTEIGAEQLGRPFLSLEKKSLTLPDLPAPWFIYAFMGAGIITCLVTCTGHIAAETSHGCCLTCYTLLQILLLLAQFAFAGAIFFDHHWREDIPDEPTGELDKIKRFVEENFNICKWVSLAVVIIEALGLLVAMTLRAISGNSRKGYDSDDDYLAPRSSARQPLVNRQANQATSTTPVGTPAENRPARNDAWSTRMREKYGLDTAEFTYNPSESRRFGQQNPAPATEEKQSRCTIM